MAASCPSLSDASELAPVTSLRSTTQVSSLLVFTIVTPRPRMGPIKHVVGRRADGVGKLTPDGAATMNTGVAGYNTTLATGSAPSIGT